MGGEAYTGQTTSTSGFPGQPQPKLDFYLVRRDGTHVPMIALDEIDPRFRVAGLPKTLTAYDVEKWNMSRVGDIINGPRMTYEVVYVGPQEGQVPNIQASPSPNESPSLAASQSEDYDTITAQMPISNDAGQTSSLEDVTSAPPPAHDSGDENHFDHAAKQHKAAMDNHPSKTKDAMTPGVYGKKKYCTYWIRTGNCDYVQEGCKYLHIIPDEETRQNIGIRDMPRWAKEDLPAPVQSQRGKNDHAGMKIDWRRDRAATDGPAPAKQTSKKFTPSIPTFLDKSNESIESKNPAHDSASLNPTAQSFEMISKPTSAGDTSNTSYHSPQHGFTRDAQPDITYTTKSFAHKMQLNSGDARKNMQPNEKQGTTQKPMQRHGELDSRAQHAKFHAPDRMPTLPAGSQSGLSNLWAPPKIYAPVTYPKSPASFQTPPTSWSSQKSPWNTKPSTHAASYWPESNNDGDSTSISKISGVRTTAEMINSLNFGHHSNSPLTQPDAFTNSKSSDGSGYRSPAINTPATENGHGLRSNHGVSKKSSPVSPLVGGISHPRLFAREGEPKHAFSPLQRQQRPSDGRKHNAT